jgi:hypothetical protein
MKSAILAAFSLLAPFGQAFTIPGDLGDGVWKIHHDGKGNAVGEPKLIGHVNHNHTSPSARMRRQSAPPLPNPDVNCGDGHNINRGDFNGAWSGFDYWCDQGQYYAPYTAVWYTYGSAIAYMCTYSGWERCWRSEYDESVILDDISCGQDHYGWVYIGAYDKSYGRDNSGANICF